MIDHSLLPGIYVHIPFCLKKCCYCDFYSLPQQEHYAIDEYVTSLLREIKLRRAELDQPAKSIYLGGGTPSLLSPRQIERIIEALSLSFTLPGDVEISMEANPATLNLRHIRDCKAVGINRISLGVQSFADQDLQVLGRMHDAHQARQAIADLETAGIENINIDLIYGIPGQSRQCWEENMEIAAGIKPAHISAYLLQLSSQTPLAYDIENGLAPCQDEDNEVLMYETACTYLADEGYEHYEISNFCRPGYACRHNLVYWQAREYLGIGCGAVSFKDNMRFMVPPELNEYLDYLQAGVLPPFKQLETMNARQRAIDALILGLRMCCGINVQAFKLRFGFDIINEFKEIISLYMNRGLLKIENECLRFTPQGYFLSNQVLYNFFE